MDEVLIDRGRFFQPNSRARPSSTTWANWRVTCLSKGAKSAGLRRNASDQTGVSTESSHALSAAFGFVGIGGIKIEGPEGIQDPALSMPLDIFLERGGDRFFLRAVATGFSGLFN